MFLIKIFHFLKGYVILSVKGHNKERFLTEYLKSGATPYSAEIQNDKLVLSVSVTDFFKLRNVKEKALIHIEQKHGAVFLLHRLKKRFFWIAGAVMLVLCFAVGSQFIWTVELDGAEKEQEEQIYNALDIAGIKPGLFKPLMKDPIDIKNIVLDNTDNISWAWLYVKGTKAVLKVRRSIIAPEVFDTNIPCDIVAVRSGIIKKITAKRGKSVAAENQTVEPGDVLISGTYDFENEPGYQVHADGIAEAYTVHTAENVYKQYYCYKTYTGRKKRLLKLNLFGKEIPLYLSSGTNFENYDENTHSSEAKIGKDFYIGIGVKITVLSEYDIYKEPLSYDAAVELAKNELERKIAEELLPGAWLTDKNVEAKSIDNETISVRLTMNFIERIGTEKRIEEVDFIEPKTDKPAAGD